jgi:tetratricopeptide (TPR) repeat protein
MNGTRRITGLAMFAALGLFLACSVNALALPPAQGQDAGASKQPYTMPEYNAYQACAAEKNPAPQIKCMDDFVARYPNSALLLYIYPIYSQAYSQLKNYAKVIEYSDKLVALGDKVDTNGQWSALFARAYAYTALNTNDAAQAKAARDAAVAGLKLVPHLTKPATMDDKAFEATTIFNATGALSSRAIKDWPAAIGFYMAILAINPDDTASNYQLGQAYLGLAPPKPMDAFWYIAKAVTSKSTNEQQAKTIKAYLRKLMFNYQQAACDNLTDAELNELLQLAGSSADRPASYQIPSAADMDAAHKDMTILSVITDLKAGGDKAKVTWLAACGLEFPDVPGRLLEVVPGADAVVLKTGFVTSQAEFDAAKTPNMEFKVAGQPGVEKLEKDSAPRITGTLVSYDPDPAFMLHWDKAKVNAEDLPKEKEKPVKKPVKKPVAKRPVAKKPA